MRHRKRNPKPGDMIMVRRLMYHHWALYLGDGYVIHVTSADEEPAFTWFSGVSVGAKKAKVKKQLLKEVVGEDDWKVNNKYDYRLTPLPVTEIIRRAKDWIDKEVPYNLLINNCKNFVIMLRYGKFFTQAEEFARTGLVCASGVAALAIGLPVFAGFLSGLAGYKLGKWLARKRLQHSEES